MKQRRFFRQYSCFFFKIPRLKRRILIHFFANIRQYSCRSQLREQGILIHFFAYIHTYFLNPKAKLRDFNSLFLQNSDIFFKSEARLKQGILLNFFANIFIHIIIGHDIFEIPRLKWEILIHFFAKVHIYFLNLKQC